MALGGRPKEDGGHKPLKITLCISVYEYLGRADNKSEFIESLTREYANRLRLKRTLGELFFSR